jgi:hypothetical protein
MTNLQIFLFTGEDKEGFPFHEIYYASSPEEAKAKLADTHDFSYDFHDEVAVVMTLIKPPGEQAVGGPADTDEIESFGGENYDDDAADTDEDED